MAKYLLVPASASHGATTPDTAALDIVGDIDLTARVLMDDWTPTSARGLIGKFTATGNQRSYLLRIATSGVVELVVTTDGTSGTVVTMVSTVGTGLTNGTAQWIRGTLDVDDGGGNRVANFYLGGSGAAPSWVQLGTTVTTAGAVAIFSGTALTRIGFADSGGTGLGGRQYRGQIFNGIAGSLVADFNGADFTVGDTVTDTAVDSTGKTWTILGAGSFIEDDAPPAGGGHTNRLLLGVG